MNLRSTLTIPALAASIFLTAPQTASAVPVHIYYLDAAGFGFNDPALGPQRRLAFEITMQGLAASIQGNVPIDVNTYFIYGRGAAWGYNDGFPNQFWVDFPGGFPGINYPIALANQLAGYDGSPGVSDMTITFNGDLDIYGGNYGETYYYGWDGYSGSDVDFITETAHGFLRGAGFYSLLNPANGEYYVLEGQGIGYPDILTAQLAYSKTSYWDKKSKVLIELPAKKRKKAVRSINKLRWKGPNLTAAAGGMINMYAPKFSKKYGPPYGMIDHFDQSFGAAEIMWPYYIGPVHSLNAAKFALQDMGWSVY